MSFPIECEIFLRRLWSAKHYWRSLKTSNVITRAAAKFWTFIDIKSITREAFNERNFSPTCVNTEQRLKTVRQQHSNINWYFIYFSSHTRGNSFNRERAMGGLFEQYNFMTHAVGTQFEITFESELESAYQWGKLMKTKEDDGVEGGCWFV